MDSHRWWREAVVYQVYLRSFADGDGDGIGDFRGLIRRLSYITELGVDAIWLSPCFRSPQRDSGYDVADFMAIDPVYGTMADFEAFVDAAHSVGLRVLLDLVPNHVSSDHEWFRAALSGGDAQARARFFFRPGSGPGEPPNNWQSVFGGSAWSVADDGSAEWYMHSFDASQPDLDWNNADVLEHFDVVLRHWFDLGVDGFRIDVAHGLLKADGLPDWPGTEDGTGGHNRAQWDQPAVHDVYRRWRGIASSHPTGEKYLVGEVWVPSRDRMHRYVRADELHHAFEFDLLVQPWSAPRFRETIDRILRDQPPEGPVWTLSNHDVHRTVTRYGQTQVLDRPDPTDMLAAARRRGPVDVELGTARARAALLLLLALPGAVYLYQGEELGLPEVLDLPDSARTDPVWSRSGGAQLGRDGCRVPLPWSRTQRYFGFSTMEPWLPQPDGFGAFAADDQIADPGSTLTLYRSAIASRRSLFRSDPGLEWLPSPPNVVAWRRGDSSCVVNFGTKTVLLDTDDAAPLASAAAIERHDRVVHLVPQGALWARGEVGFVDRRAHGSRQTTPDAAREELQSTAI